LLHAAQMGSPSGLTGTKPADAKLLRTQVVGVVLRRITTMNPCESRFAGDVPRIPPSSASLPSPSSPS
jgi:hypothetical protein